MGWPEGWHGLCPLAKAMTKRGLRNNGSGVRRDRIMEISDYRRRHSEKDYGEENTKEYNLAPMILGRIKSCK